MLLPTQQTYGLAATNMMQSMLDRIEEQRRQDEEKRTGKERDPVAEARISASEEAKRARETITSALFGANRVDPNELKIDLINRLAGRLGIDPEEARSSFRLGKALEDALKSMLPTEIAELERDLGLDDLEISIKTLLAAIKNPYGDDGQRLTDALNRKATGGKLDTEVERVVQKLEDVADPKTLEELKLGPQGYDPTRVEDDQTRAERREDMEAAEAGKKLEEVQKVQDAVERQNESVKTQPVGATTGGQGKIPEDILLAVLAAAAEEARSPAPEGATVDPISDPGKTDLADIGSPSHPPSAVEELDPDAPDTLATALADISAQSTRQETAILPVTIDEIGIYQLLKNRLAA